jgi:hypothetical protein
VSAALHSSPHLEKANVMARAIVVASRIALARGHGGADTVRGNGGAHSLYGQVSIDALNSPDGLSANDTLDGTPGTHDDNRPNREDDYRVPVEKL